jgi:hypothetical protein
MVQNPNDIVSIISIYFLEKITWTDNTETTKKQKSKTKKRSDGSRKKSDCWSTHGHKTKKRKIIKD